VEPILDLGRIGDDAIVGGLVVVDDEATTDQVVVARGQFVALHEKGFLGFESAHSVA
jgi:hypothetical protein